MAQEYNKPTAPFYQQDMTHVNDSECDSAISDQVYSLQKWVILSIVGNVMSTIGIIGFLIFIYYSLLIELQDGQ